MNSTFIFSTHDPKIMQEAEVTLILEDGYLHNGQLMEVAAHA